MSKLEYISEELLKPIVDKDRELESISKIRLSYKEDVINRLIGNNLAVFGFIIIAIIIIVAVALPFFYPYGYNDQSFIESNIPTILKVYTDDYGNMFYTNSDQKVWILNYNGNYMTQMGMVKEDLSKKQMMFELNDKKVILDYNNRKLTLLQSTGKEFTNINKTLNKQHILGTDSLGRDMFIRIVYGARISLLIAFVATVVNLIIGVLYGSIAGYAGGQIDNVMMRIVDIIDTIPLTLYVILIMITIGTGLKSIIIAIGSVYWIGMARLVRGQVLTLKNQEYIMVAQTIGTSTKDIIIRHILPNAMGPIIVSLVLSVPSAIFTEAFLSYIGLGIPVPLASWGTLCNDAVEVLKIYPYQLIEPSVAICITMFAFNFLGDGLRDALDPKMRK